MSGRTVADDAVIRAIRNVKTMLRIAKNNELVVCADCMEAYRAKRAKYERDLAIHAVIGGLVLLLFVLLPLFTSGFSLVSVLLGLLLFGLIMLLSVFSHCPKIEGGAELRAAPHAALKSAAADAKGMPAAKRAKKMQAGAARREAIRRRKK
jgi:hypothetical protein